tara:strand:+ start:3646 stop:3930 length:285 start_codon:yes stop_codon:yes gene_type:complete
MANKKQLLKQLADYFAEKGKFLSAAEYKAAEDAPMRFVIAKRPFGSWSRVASMIKTNYPEEWAKMNTPVVEEAPKPAPKKATKAATKPKATKGK